MSLCVCVFVFVHVCMCACMFCMCVSIMGEEWGGSVFDDRFVYVNNVCFDVGCLNLSVKCTCLGLI